MPISFHSFEIVILCMMGIIFVGTIFWVWMLIDCAINKRIADSQKRIWLVVIFFTHLLGALLYFFLGRSSAQQTQNYQPYTQSQTPRTPQVPYYPYQQGYQPAPPPPPQFQSGSVPPPASYEHDYEQPQAMYPHEQNNE